MKNNYTNIICGIFLLTLLSGFVSAAGIAMPYWAERPLHVYPGQQGYFDVSLQNGVGDEDLKFVLSLGGDTNLVSLEETEYLVPAHTTDMTARVHYSIPENVAVGDTYSVSITADTMSPYDTGGIEVGVGMGQSFQIIIVEEPAASSVEGEEEEEPTLNMIWYVILVIVIVCAIVYFVMRKRRK